MCKKKHVRDARLPQKAFSRFLLPLLLGFAILLPSASFAAGEPGLRTGNDVGSIERDPDTGNRVMRTPGLRPQQEPQGPQTIIVAPQVYPDGVPGRHPGPRPPHPGAKPPHPAVPLPHPVPPVPSQPGP